MKKFLAILMTLAMLLSVCAFAEGEGAEIILGDIRVFAGETALLDLSGLALRLGVYSDDENVGVQLAVDANDTEALALNVASESDGLLLGMSGVSDVYSLSYSSIAQMSGLDLDAILNMEAVTEAITAEDMTALTELAGEIAEAFVAGTTDGGMQEADGETYHVTNVNVTEDQIQPLLEKAVAILDNYSYLLEDSDIESFSELYTELTPALSVNGAIYEQDDAVSVELVINASVLEGSEKGYLALNAAASESEEDRVDVYVELSVGTEEEDYTLAFNLGLVDENDGSWMPISDAPVDLLAALEDETLSSKLATEAMASAMMALSQMAVANETVAALMTAA